MKKESMNQEKIIIESELLNIRLISAIILLIGFILFIIVWCSGTSSSFYREGMVDSVYVWGNIVPYFMALSFLPVFIIGLIFVWWTSKVKLVVTDKRVYGYSTFGRRIDLPFDSIRAVSSAMLKTIKVTTASGSVNFSLIKNCNEIHDELSKLLIGRQKNTSVKSEKEVENKSDSKKAIKNIKNF